MADVRDFLFEIGTEEMPSAPLNNAASQMGKMVPEALDRAGLSHGKVSVLTSPRRLCVHVADVAAATDAIHEVKRGPAASIAFDAEGVPTKAAEGFARKCGVSASELIRREDTDGREYVFAEKSIDSIPAEPILSELCASVLGGLQWPNYRSQRWGATHETFVRPVRWLCVLFGTEVVPVSFAGVESGATTRGHRVLAAGDHRVASASLVDYRDALGRAYVMPDEDRRRLINEEIARIEAERGVRVERPRSVFDEVVNLCEWPTVLIGRFDDEFLAVPHEIICESMLSNQRYFPIYDSDGKLTPEFVVVSNGRPECAETIIDGNERVVRARLYDAKFFYDEDLKVSLEEFRSRLASVGFQKKLGSVLQKSERMEDLALVIGREARVGASSASDAQRAAHLAKADLVSSAVVEFTSQQGVMGGYYALAAGEAPEVAAAIRDHYRPRFAGDELPEGIAGCIVAVADKIDTIAGMFAIDEPPTGSKDPFALRRAAIGVINMLSRRLSCGFEAIVDAALDLYLEQGLSFNKAAVKDAACAFIKGRMEQLARDNGVPTDVVAAVSAGDITVPADFFELCSVLQTARTEDPDTFENLATAYARAAHLADASLGDAVDQSLLNDAEAALSRAIDDVAAVIGAASAEKRYLDVVSALASLRAPIDRFFDEVMVMDEDESLRNNRLRLLNRFESVFSGIADISQLAK